jgi:hypothetical protein
MSLKAILWALENGEVFSSAQKFVLVALANYADEQGNSFPQVATICRLTKQSDDTVRRCLEKLREDGFIKDTGKKFGPTQQVRVWQLPPETWENKDPLGAGLSSKSKARHKTEDPGKTPARPRQDPRHAGRSLEPVTEEPKEGLPEKTPSPTRLFSDGWCAAYKAKYGADYPYNGRDGKAASELLKHSRPEEILSLAKRAWEQTDDKKFWACYNHSSTVYGFASYLPKIRVELSRANNAPTSSGFGQHCP